jgi:serine/threonine-protein phosphatase PP1 catalytic subunit
LDWFKVRTVFVFVFIFFSFLFFSLIYKQKDQMGNSVSKKKSKKQKERKQNTLSSSSSQPAPQLNLPATADNEYSVNTTQSVNSILITSSQHRGQKNNNNNSALSQLNPDYPVHNSNDNNDEGSPHNEQDTIQAGQDDPFQGKVEHPQQHKLLAQSDFWPPKKPVNGDSLDVTSDNANDNQLTVSSMNQLTMNSVSSMNMNANMVGLQIDDYIKRLLDAGYASKVPKQLCLKNSEVNAICRAAMDIFLSQPVKK